jgi:hypothetical protein
MHMHMLPTQATGAWLLQLILTKKWHGVFLRTLRALHFFKSLLWLNQRRSTVLGAVPHSSSHLALQHAVHACTAMYECEGATL